MFQFVLSAALAAAAPPSTASPTASLPAGVKHDLQCFVLFTAVAGAEKDETKLTGIIAGTWYFLGRIDAAAPAIDLDRMVRATMTEMEGNPATKDLGPACEAQFSKRGQDMSKMGQDLRKAPD